MREAGLGVFAARLSGRFAAAEPQLARPLARREQAEHKDEEHRHQKQREDDNGDHAAHHGAAERLLALCASARRDHHRRDAADEGQTRHQNRAEAHAAGFERRVAQRLALLVELLRELDDQNAVLCRKANDGDERHCQIHVVRQSAQHRSSDDAENAERNGQKHGERNRPTLVERCEHEEHQQHREREQERRLRAGLLFLQRLAGPFEAEAARQLPRELLHFLNGVARGVAGLRGAGHAHRRIVVEAHDLRRTNTPIHGSKRRERHELACAVAHPIRQDLVGLHARATIGLHHHALHAPAVREVVDVARAEIGRDGVVDLLEGDAERGRLLAVDVEPHLRRGRQSFNVHVLQDRAALRRGEQLILGLHQLVVAALSAVLQTEAEARRVAEVVDRRRLKRGNLRVVDRAHLLIDIGDDLLSAVVRAALRPVLQRDERLRGVLALPQEAEAGEEGHVLDAGALQQILLDRLHRVERTIERRFRWRLHVGRDEALIVDRQEAARQTHETIAHRADQHGVDDHDAAGARQRARDETAIAAARGLHPAVEPTEEAALFVMVPRLNRLEQRRAERGCQRQSEERREADGRDHRHRELLVDDADRAREERHRNEHGDQNRRDADDGAGDLAHRLARGLLRRQPLLRHDALDVLDHDDGVVDEDADGEHHAEHGEHVDGETHRQQDHAGAEERDRHDDGRNERVADVLEEQQHHEEDEDDGLHQRHQHLLDRGLDHRRDVVGDVVLDVRREVVGQLVHLLLHARGRGERIAGRREKNRKARRLLAVLPRGELIAEATDLDARDVAQPHGRAVGVGAQKDRTELVRAIELALHDDERGDLLAGVARLDADAAGGDLCVLRADRPGNVVRRQVEGGELARIEPDAKRTLGRIERGAADAGDAADLAQDVADHEVAEADLVQAAVGGSQRDDLKNGARRLFDQDALLDHRARQARLDALDAILHLDRGAFGVRARYEVRDDLDLAERVARGFEVQDAARAVELLFDQARDTVVEVLRRRARIAGADRDRRRRDDRILRDRQERNRQQAAQTNQKRHDPREDGPVDEKARHYESSQAARLARRGRYVRLALFIRLRRDADAAPRLRTDGVARHELLEALDDHALTGLHAFEHQPLIVHHAADPDRTDHGAIVVAQHEQLAATGVVAANRLLRHRERIGVDALLDLHAHKHAGEKLTLRIREFAAQRHLSRGAIHGRIGEQQPAGQRIGLVVIEDQPHVGGIGLEHFEIAALEGAAKLIHLGDGLGKVRVDGVERLDGREMRGLVLPDQRALGDERTADAARDRRTDDGVAEVELGAGDIGLARGDVGVSLTHRRGRGLVLHVGDGLARQQRLHALGLLTGLFGHGLSLGERGLGGLQFDLERRGIEPVEDIARVDVAALLEVALDHDAGHARAHFGDPGRRDTARQLAHIGTRGRLHRDDADLLRRGVRRGRRAFAASLEGESQQTSNEHHASRYFPIGHSQPFL